MYVIWPLSPSEETVLISLWGSSEPGPTEKSSSRESTLLRPDMDERERCGLAALWGEFSLPGGDGETQEGEGDGESTEGLKWAWAWPVNLKGELRRKGEAGEWGGVVLEDDDRGTAAGGGVEQNFWLLLFTIWETGKQRIVLNWNSCRAQHQITFKDSLKTTYWHSDVMCNTCFMIMPAKVWKYDGN